MKFTIWEKKIIHDVVCGVKHANVGEIAQLLELRELFELSSEELEIFEAKKKSENIDQKEVDITINRAQLKIIHQKLNSNNVRLPVLTETLLLLEKISTQIKKLSEA